MLEFDWDEDNLRHIARHSVTAEEIEFVLTGWTLDLGMQDWQDEERFSEVGETADGRVLVVVATWRGIKLRVVTAFDASKNMSKAYRSLMVI